MPLDDNIFLLVDGKKAFPEILRCIESAQYSIVINMFIWRADCIGIRIAEAVLAAADRGVKVSISVDRYGLVLEKCEECMHSFFHESPTFAEQFKIASLKILYPSLYPKNPPVDTHKPLFEKMLGHPNIKVSRDVFKADHSKYYVFDDEVLILGGINIEDKENGADISGRVYGDYMVKLVGKDMVSHFYDKIKNGLDTSDKLKFTLNSKELSPHLFEMENVYLDLIRSAEKQLVIIMAYFSPLAEFVDAIVDASKRGVDVTVMIPICANFQNDLNRKTVCKLLRKSGGKVKIKLSPRMLHTKLMFSEKTISMGSTNITRKAFGQLSELNLTMDNVKSQFTDMLMSDIYANLAASHEVSDADKIKYRLIMAFLEGFVV